MNWILFGFKGVGKTYFGSRLGLPLIDTDQLIEERENRSIRELIKQKGELYFRECERQVVQTLCVANHIIAVGGGTVCDLENLKHLQALGTLIYLRRTKESVKEKLLTPPLPTFLENETFEKHYSTRIAKYERIPSIGIELDGKTDQAILEELWQVIKSAPFSGSLPGENHMAEPLALSSTAAPRAYL